MRLMSATVQRMRSGSLYPYMFGHADGVPDEGLSLTLLMFLGQADARHDAELLALLAEAEAGRYVPDDPGLPDWGINDINLWLRPPQAHPGHICISNENTEYCFDGEAGSQQFTFAQFRAALKHWREFEALLTRDGKAVWVGKRFEAELP